MRKPSKIDLEEINRIADQCREVWGNDFQIKLAEAIECDYKHLNKIFNGHCPLTPIMRKAIMYSISFWRRSKHDPKDQQIH